MSITHQPFGTDADGARVTLYTLTNAAGLAARVMSYGATLLALHAPDRQGRLADILLGFDTFAPYAADHPYFGSVVGRYGNRIAQGRFALNGREFQLALTNGQHHLHGGIKGFGKVLWQGAVVASAEGEALELRYTSRDGEEGYPGALNVLVRYTLNDQNELRLDYTASSDAPTVLNLTNHAYFNLAGAGDVLSHELQLFAARFLPTDASQIPTGELRAVVATPMDFSIPTAIGARIRASDEQLERAHGGYDHTWVIDRQAAGLAQAARVYEPGSGRLLEVWTTQPGVQFYTGNFLDGNLVGKRGQVYAKHAGFCLETQHFPDSPNQPHFPTTTLNPGETYQHTTLFRLGTAQ